ncbi:MAG: hypothetical protein RIS47_1190 [Bacteroidota bacterium]|jgi:hypothetical protein
MEVAMDVNISVVVAQEMHYGYAQSVCDMIDRAAQHKGSGLARRKPEYVLDKMMQGKAVIALNGEEVIGFCYIETWSHGKYVANSGLIVDPDYRGYGLARSIKAEAFKLSRYKFPDAKIFGLTTSLAVMKINSDLGYRPVTFSELTNDDEFWKGCESCNNYDILVRTKRVHCLCNGMMFDPNWEHLKQNKIGE